MFPAIPTTQHLADTEDAPFVIPTGWAPPSCAGSGTARSRDVNLVAYAELTEAISFDSVDDEQQAVGR